MVRTKETQPAFGYILKNSLQLKLVQAAVEHMIESFTLALADAKGRERNEIKKELREACILKELFKAPRPATYIYYGDFINIASALEDKIKDYRSMGLKTYANNFCKTKSVCRKGSSAATIHFYIAH